MSSRPIHLDSIRLDGDTQPRAEIDEAVVAEYYWFDQLTNEGRYAR